MNINDNRWPLTVRLRRQVVSHGRWQSDSWSVTGVESDRQATEAGLRCSERTAAEDGSDFRWRGLALVLHRDERAAYRFNLGSGDPRLFIVCNEETGGMRPLLITASQDEAASYMDGGEEDVFSTPMPEAICCWIERFIARHGEPELQVGKGKRRNHGPKTGSTKVVESGACHP